MNDFHIPTRSESSLRLIAVDLDKTLAWPTWKPNQKRSVIGDPIPANVEKLKEAYAAGYMGFIHTSRHDADTEMIIEWLKHFDLMQYMYPRRAVVTGKPLAHRYLDDKAVNPITQPNERWF